MRSHLLFCLQICGFLACVLLLPDPRSPSDLCQPPTQLSPRLPKPKVSINRSLQRRPEHSPLQSTKKKKNPIKFKKYLCCLLISWRQPGPEIAPFPEQAAPRGAAARLQQAATAAQGWTNSSRWVEVWAGIPALWHLWLARDAQEDKATGKAGRGVNSKMRRE